MLDKASREFRLTKIDETRNKLLEEIKHNDLMSEKYRKTCQYLTHVKHLLILTSIVIGCFSISAFASLVCVPVGIASSVAGISICAITAGIKKYKSYIKKKKKKHDKLVLLGNDKSNAIEVLVSRVLIDSCISHISDEAFISVNNVSREYNEMKKEIKLLKLLRNTLYKPD